MEGMRHLLRAAGALIHSLTAPVEETSAEVAAASKAGEGRDVDSPEPGVFPCSVDTDRDSLTLLPGFGKVTIYAERRDSDDHGTDVTVSYTPAAARRFAAAVLNLADSEDGTTPLTFVPRGPEEGGVSA